MQTDAGPYSVVVAANGRMRDSLKGVDTPTALPYVLEAQRFAQLGPNDRRAFLFGLMGLSVSGAEVRKRLLAKNHPSAYVEAVIPMLRAGFDVAHTSAQDQARDQKAVWRVITGEKKAETWAAQKLEVDAAALAELADRSAAIGKDVESANQRVGALDQDSKRRAEILKRLDVLRAKAGPRQVLAEQLQADEAALLEKTAKIQNVRDTALSQNALPCPECER
ncbi:hypothetical protein EO087_02215 [Dyella sp. M7H15-1]|uniref:hypothetical protein n=1 Tax=Dyella sp. M7H15-1 TaxID=2501295 RepID=UPI0010051CCA|nr:hypothetical protein [Dyella sp. M7H15-1]QAU22952.1 hypothetical protein EO087_02215 [Dyella sp. M7H15-1]